MKSYIPKMPELILVAYGISARLARSAVMQARAKGLRVGLFRPITLFPFPEEALFQLTAKNTQAFLVVELSAGQMIEDVERVTRRQKPVHFHGRTGGNIPTVDEIYDQIVQIMNKGGN